MLNINSILGNIFKDSSLEYGNFEKLIISRIDLEKRILRKKTNLGTDIGINLNSSTKLQHGEILLEAMKQKLLLNKCLKK